jgi:hypothetical protein
MCSAQLPRLRGFQASAYLEKVHGIERKPATLAKYRCVGGGPRFQHAARIPYYTPAELDAYALSILSPLKSSTSDAGEVAWPTRATKSSAVVAGAPSKNEAAPRAPTRETGPISKLNSATLERPRREARSAEAGQAANALAAAALHDHHHPPRKRREARTS